jgi:hypothetical protein
LATFQAKWEIQMIANSFTEEFELGRLLAQIERLEVRMADFDLETELHWRELWVDFGCHYRTDTRPSHYRHKGHRSPLEKGDLHVRDTGRNGNSNRVQIATRAFSK